MRFVTATMFSNSHNGTIAWSIMSLPGDFVDNRVQDRNFDLSDVNDRIAC